MKELFLVRCSVLCHTEEAIEEMRKFRALEMMNEVERIESDESLMVWQPGGISAGDIIYHHDRPRGGSIVSLRSGETLIIKETFNEIWSNRNKKKRA